MIFNVCHALSYLLEFVDLTIPIWHMLKQIFILVREDFFLKLMVLFQIQECLPNHWLIRREEMKLLFLE